MSDMILVPDALRADLLGRARDDRAHLVDDPDQAAALDLFIAQLDGGPHRAALPARRLADTISVTTGDGHTVHLSIGFAPDDPTRPREIFYSGGFKSGSQLEFQVQDACVLISLALQLGLTPAQISCSLARDEQPTGLISYASITGLIVAELVAATAA